MKGLLKPAGRIAPARFLGHAISRRRLQTMTLGAAAMLLFAPSGAFALSNATLALSPMVAKSTLLSAMDPAKEIIVQFTLPLSDRQGAQDLLKHVSTPKDPLYRHYITAQEFAARFGANAADYASVRAWAVANGLSIVHEASARTSLSLRGTVAQMQNLFKTQLNYYKTPAGDQFYSASVAPTIPSELVSKIQALIGLTGSVQKASLYKIGRILGEHPKTPPKGSDTAGGTGPGGTYSASDLRTAYLIPTFGGASPQTVAVFEDSSITASDFSKYLSTNHLPKIKLTQIPVDQTTVGMVNGDEVEAVLDVDMIAAINPDVKEIQIYVAPEITGTTNEQEESAFSTDLIDVFDAVGMAFSNTGQPQTLSVSYGLDEILMEDGGDILGEANALAELGDIGVTVLVSAGDDGAYGDTGLSNNPVTLNAADPGSQPFVTCVGGTTLFTFMEQQYLGEEVWNDLGIGDGATGGGVSNFWPNPQTIFNESPYQDQNLVAFNGGDPDARNVPDVAAVGDPLTGVGIYLKDQGGWIQLGGTSVSAPIWGGYVSILNSAAQFLSGATPVTPKIGFFNPLLYFTAESFIEDTSFPGLSGLYPVLDGSNGNLSLYGVAGFNAGLFYNNCCGLGSLWGPFSFLTLASQNDNGTAVTVTAAPSTTSAKITWTESTGATGYAVFVQLFQYNTNTNEYDGTYVAQTAITKKTNLDVKGLLANQIVVAPNVPPNTLLFQYSVNVAAVGSSGITVSNAVNFFTKKGK
jgi:subtilase family serine protease